jgi:hypothetical protein
MSVIQGKRKEREKKWYETPSGKLRLKVIVMLSKLPVIGKVIQSKYSQLPGVIKHKR